VSGRAGGWPGQIGEWPRTGGGAARDFRCCAQRHMSETSRSSPVEVENEKRRRSPDVSMVSSWSSRSTRDSCRTGMPAVRVQRARRVVTVDLEREEHRVRRLPRRRHGSVPVAHHVAAQRFEGSGSLAVCRGRPRRPVRKWRGVARAPKQRTPFRSWAHRALGSAGSPAMRARADSRAQAQASGPLRPRYPRRRRVAFAGDPASTRRRGQRQCLLSARAKAVEATDTSRDEPSHDEWAHTPRPQGSHHPIGTANARSERSCGASSRVGRPRRLGTDRLRPRCARALAGARRGRRARTRRSLAGVGFRASRAGLGYRG
jgi:hypothetical protein